MDNYLQNPQNRDKQTNYVNHNKSMVRVVSTIALSVLVVIIIVGACIGCYFGGRNAEINYNMQDDLAIANEVYTLIKQHYYMDITKEEFNEWAAVGLAAAMDQFSNLSYVSASPTPQFGISILSDSYNNHIISYISKSADATNPTPAQIAEGKYLDNPTEKTKLECGDMLLSVNDVSVVGLTNEMLNSASFLGDPALLVKPCKIVVQKTNGRKAEFELTKKYISTSNTEYLDFGDGIGYIRLKSFTGKADEEFKECAKQFKANANHKLILDLRDNGGGSVSILSKIASYIIHDKNGNSNGLNIIKLDTDKGSSYSMCTAEGNNWLGKGISDYKLVVLVNENSASASEALLGAIKYYCNEATIIGSPTYGKGIAQQTYTLATTDKYLLSITIGYFYVPVDDKGKQGWKSYHGQSMMPSSNDLTLSKFANEIDFTKNDFYKDYYNNNLKEEKAVKLALEQLKN